MRATIEVGPFSELFFFLADRVPQPNFVCVFFTIYVRCMLRVGGGLIAHRDNVTIFVPMSVFG